METRKELKQIINELNDKLQKAQDKLENLTKNERWKPNENDVYWFVDDLCKIDCTYYNTRNKCDNKRYNAYNTFYTQEEAEREANKILIRRKLEDLARSLNDGIKIDWEDFNQIKYYIFYNNETQVLNCSVHYATKSQGTIYCLDPDFIYKAIDEIGKQELINYIKGE